MQVDAPAPAAASTSAPSHAAASPPGPVASAAVPPAEVAAPAPAPMPPRPSKYRHEWLQMQTYVEIAIFAKKLKKERVSVTIGKQQLDVVILDEQASSLPRVPHTAPSWHCNIADAARLRCASLEAINAAVSCHTV